VGAGLAPRAFGLAGSTAERALYGAASGGAINAADTAARGGGLSAIVGSGALGAGVGGAFPVAGKGLGALSRAVAPTVDAATQRLIQRAADLGTRSRISKDFVTRLTIQRTHQ
jgi:hypothetical protein